jgi:uncharacterized protein (DUF2267 family)
MKYDEFISAVKKETNVASREEAEQTAFVVLDLLGQRLTGSEADDLYAQLPEPLKSQLMERVRPDDPAQRIKADEFISKVGDELGVTHDEAEARIRGVFAVLRTAVTPGEIDDVLSQLDRSYRQVLAPSAP